MKEWKYGRKQVCVYIYTHTHICTHSSDESCIFVCVCAHTCVTDSMMVPHLAKWWERTLYSVSRSAVSDFCDPMDYSSPGSSVHGISQARILEWVAISFSRGSSWPRHWTPASPVLAGGVFTTEPSGKPIFVCIYAHTCVIDGMMVFHLAKW